MAPPAFDDFAGSCSSLFDDHHQAGELKFSQKIGDFDISANTSHGAQSVDWKLATNIGGLNVEYDSSNKLSKSLELAIKQVEGLKLTWNSNFCTASGLDLGNINANFSNDKLNLNVESSLEAAPQISFNASTDVKCASVGVKGSFDVKASALGAIGWGLHSKKGNVEVSFVNEDINSPLNGMLHIYQLLPDNKDFCCYGIQADTATGNLSFGAASSCCDKNTMRYRLNKDGQLDVAKVQKLSKACAFNISASLNLKDLSAGGHTFGAGLSFE